MLVCKLLSLVVCVWLQVGTFASLTDMSADASSAELKINLHQLPTPAVAVDIGGA